MMRIAQVAPLHERVPPRLYGGTERVVHYLTEELVARGHEVTLFASGDSLTSARLIGGAPCALRNEPNCRDPLIHHLILLERVAALAGSFDLVHYHLDYFHFPVTRAYGIPSVTTLHGRLDLPDLPAMYREYPEMPLVSISESQRLPLADANWQATIYHGLPASLLTPGPGAGGYLAFLGRISPEKRLDRAIEIARRSGRRLKVAAKIDPADAAYFDTHVRHLLDEPCVEFIGEIGEQDKAAFLGNAAALLFPIDWPEPFGLVVIEALACGTPTIAFRAGSVPELLVDGVTGFIVDSVDAAVDAVSRLGLISRRRCRAEFDRRFTAARMAGQYLSVYDALASGVPVPQGAAM